MKSTLIVLLLVAAAFGDDTAGKGGKVGKSGAETGNGGKGGTKSAGTGKGVKGAASPVDPEDDGVADDAGKAGKGAVVSAYTISRMDTSAHVSVTTSLAIAFVAVGAAVGVAARFRSSRNQDYTAISSIDEKELKMFPLHSVAITTEKTTLNAPGTADYQATLISA